MLERFTHGKVAWIDLHKPTDDEVRDVMVSAKIPLELLTDVTGPVPRSGVATTDKVIKLMIDYPVVKRTDIERPHDIKFFITKDSLVTARYEDISAIYKFSREFEVLSILNKAGKHLHGGHIFAALMHILYDALVAKLDYLETQMETIDKEIFSGHEKEMVVEISKVTRKLITFRQTLIAHGDVMHDAHPHFERMFGPAFLTQLHELDEYYDHIMRRMVALSENVRELASTNSALLSTKEGEVMKTLTIMAFVTFPLTLMSSMFGMNVDNMPIIHSDYAFYIILGIMTVVALFLFAYFKVKRWF
jgi:magnesium transporter